MSREEIIKDEKEKIKKIKIAMNKSVKDIKPVDTTGIVLKNAPPTKEFLERTQKNKNH